MPSVPALQGRSYISLETLRRSGVAVRTPVWFAEGADGTIYIYSVADAGKVKRIRNNGRVRIAPCDIRGKLDGDWIDAQAVIGDATMEAVAHPLLDRKYGWQKRIGNLWSRLTGRRRAVIAIRVP
jgi:PPOX class probable F420-dependent enzyme